MLKSLVLPVDSGTICLISLDFLKETWGISKELLKKSIEPGHQYFQILDIEGQFDCTLRVSLWQTNIITKTLTSDSGFYLGDPQYLFNKSNLNWAKLTQETKYFRNISEKMPLIAIKTGGDGVADVCLYAQKYVK